MQKVSELKTEPEIGKFYWVECLRKHCYWIPIIGEKHTDKELGVEKLHFHQDPRFMTDRELYGFGDSPFNALGRIHYIDDEFCIELKKKKCRRQMPEFPKVITFFNKMEKKYIGKKAKCGKCPHRNFNLDQLPKQDDGSVICNGHGLQINKDGIVVPRHTLKIKNRV